MSENFKYTNIEYKTKDSVLQDENPPVNGGFRNFNALSRRILRFANLGLPRIEFLKEISFILRDFFGCDALELWLRDNSLYYRWDADFLREDNFCFEKISSLMESVEEESEFKSWCKKIFLSGFCQGGAVETSPLQGEQCKGEVSSGIPLIWKQDLDSPASFKSITLLPFMVDDFNNGLLLLKSSKENYFKNEEMSFYEGIAQTLGIAVANRRAQAALRERIKELTCLYGICKIFKRSGVSRAFLLRKIVELIPPAMQYPDIAGARILVDGRSYSTSGFEDNYEKLSADIVIAGEIRGVVEVAYSSRHPELEVGLFLKEEQNLLETVARQVALLMERKTAEEDRKKLQEQLRHADRLATVGQIAAGVAHELNEPLGNILGFAQLASKTPSLPSQVEKDLEKIIRSSLHAREIVRKLLLFSRQAPTRKIPVDLNRAIVDVVSFFESRFPKEGIEPVLSLAQNLPPLTADLSQINQVLVNLIVNSIQAMPKGGKLTIETSEVKNGIMVAIEDTGTGMGKKVLGQMFVPFFTTKRVGEGTGLGLSVVHGIVKSHGGTIEVQSQEGRGTRFEVIFPC